MPGEATQGVLSSTNREPKAECDEQAVDGGERLAAEAGFSSRLGQRVYEESTPQCELLFSFSNIHGLELKMGWFHDAWLAAF